MYQELTDASGRKGGISLLMLREVEPQLTFGGRTSDFSRVAAGFLSVTMETSETSSLGPQRPIPSKSRCPSRSPLQSLQQRRSISGVEAGTSRFPLQEISMDPQVILRHPQEVRALSCVEPCSLHSSLKMGKQCIQGFRSRADHSKVGSFLSRRFLGVSHLPCIPVYVSPQR